MSSDPNNQGQYPPPQWENHPQRGAYPIAQQALNYRQPPPPSSSQPYPSPPGPTTGDMVTLPPPGHQQQDFYRHPPPYDMYAGHPPDMRGPPPQHMYQNQPAPRQRTAIACRYCRRRKIRCSGFEASEDGRCTNCQRFQQECIFTPVSSQAQAFVPAHTAYPHLRNAGPMQPQRGGRALYPQPGQTPIYGAHGQPLGTLPPQGVDPYPPPPQGYPMQQPPGPYPQGQVYDDRGAPQPPHPNKQVSRKRPRTDEPHPAVPPPHPPHTPSSQANQGRPSAPGGRRGSGGTGGYEYPDPTGLVPVSPASSATSYASAPYPQQQPYYAPQPPPPARRSSPQSSYSYEARASGSPHGSTSSSSAPAHSYAGGLHPPQVLPDRTGRTPPPQQRDGSNNGSAQRGGMAVRDLLGPGNENQGGRSNTDSDMLKQLNKRGM